MKLYKLSESDVQKAIGIAEDGMGYQIAELSTNGTPESGVLINNQYFAPFEAAPELLLEQRSGNFDFSNLLLLSPPTDYVDLESSQRFVRRSLILEARAPRGARVAVAAASFSPPPHSATTKPGEVFYRISAYLADRRILPDGSLAMGSYSTTDTDITVVPNGLAGIGRYALPTRISAKEVFEIRPLPGTSILYGTVTPNYGLAGGGVEVLFPHGTTPGTVRHLKTLPEK